MSSPVREFRFPRAAVNTVRPKSVRASRCAAEFSGKLRGIQRLGELFRQIVSPANYQFDKYPVPSPALRNARTPQLMPPPTKKARQGQSPGRAFVVVVSLRQRFEGSSPQAPTFVPRPLTRTGTRTSRLAPRNSRYHQCRCSCHPAPRRRTRGWSPC